MDSLTSSKLHRKTLETHPTTERIYSLYRQLDDQDLGYISIENVAKKLNELRMSSKQQVKVPLGSSDMYSRELLRICNQSHVGHISFNEFEAFVLAKDKELYELFSQIDTDNDNAIHFLDLRNAMEKVGIQVSDQDLLNFISDLDANGDGIIEFDDWRDYLLLLPHEPTLESIFTTYNAFLSVELDSNTDVVPIPTQSSRFLEFSSKFKYLLAGGIAGAVSRTITAPLDRIKVLFSSFTNLRCCYKHKLLLKLNPNLAFTLKISKRFIEMEVYLLFSEETASILSKLYQNLP